MVLPFASTKSKTLLVAFLAVSMAHQAAAAPLETNPVTPLGPVAPLDHQHPVFGGRPASDMVQAVVKADTTVSRAQLLAITNTTRRLEVSNSDVRNMEAHFQQSMEVNVETMQKKYASGEFKPSPWPSSYWPTYQDSINMKWSRSDASAAEKYAKAFGLDTQGFMDKISATTGVDSQASASRKCSSDSECSKFNDESRCGKRDGANTGYCIPTWYGLCHAWAPAAILEPEPKCSVVKNGVTFKVFDIKALLTQLYDGAGVNVVFTGARFDDADSVRDEYGRYTDAKQRDLGPGFFHIAVTNIMCRFGRSFVVDVASGAQVWNQPVRSYSINELTFMTPEGRP
ncbi:hypothetical protein Poli38472_007096 [Pythium oligandrum]|uniref:Elicitor-like transglutaminase n=1 Tax=Pythium oligandrum TaxID=41045 RepID=A0A8K1FE17_PYTOL|nr:hypothetical protein Poli38472_007096 [Pythium oligandrum]|eukprot:TMW58951.1 hypothetical protein Poli38472_007096 [Pythium oligandrum]